MASAVRERRTRVQRAQAKQRGAYLTDGSRLYRVLDAAEEYVQLENCRVPEENGSWFPVSKVVGKMRLVQPDGSR